MASRWEEATGLQARGPSAGDQSEGQRTPTPRGWRRCEGIGWAPWPRALPRTSRRDLARVDVGVREWLRDPRVRTLVLASVTVHPVVAAVARRGAAPI